MKGHKWRDWMEKEESTEPSPDESNLQPQTKYEAEKVISLEDQA